MVVLQEREPDASDSEELSELEMQDEGNKDAARALLRVKQKLDGYEEGEMRSLQGQVLAVSPTYRLRVEAYFCSYKHSKATLPVGFRISHLKLLSVIFFHRLF